MASASFFIRGQLLYHWLIASPRKVQFLRKMDHIAIYMLIAGSYTPLFYYGLTGTWKWAMLIAVWVLALIGVLLKICFMHIPAMFLRLSMSPWAGLPWCLLQLFKNLPAGNLFDDYWWCCLHCRALYTPPNVLISFPTALVSMRFSTFFMAGSIIHLS